MGPYFIFSGKKFGGPGEVFPTPSPSQWACIDIHLKYQEMKDVLKVIDDDVKLS